MKKHGKLFNNTLIFPTLLKAKTEQEITVKSIKTKKEKFCSIEWFKLQPTT